jgi:MFS family permease
VMNTRKFWTRRPLSALGKLMVAALLVVASGYAAELLHLGLDLEVSIVVAVLGLAAGLVAIGWPFTPALGALVAGLILINNPFLSFNLSNPSNLLFFAAALVQASGTLIVVVAGIAASVQQLRRRGNPLVED